MRRQRPPDGQDLGSILEVTRRQSDPRGEWSQHQLMTDMYCWRCKRRQCSITTRRRGGGDSHGDGPLKVRVGRIQNVVESAGPVPVSNGRHKCISRRKHWAVQLRAIRLLRIRVRSELVGNTVVVEDVDRATSGNRARFRAHASAAQRYGGGSRT